MCKEKVLVCFDFDGTITTKDTFRDILIWHFGLLTFSFWFLLHSPLVILYLAGIVRNDVPKRWLFKMMFSGMDRSSYESVCIRYAKERLPCLIRKKALERIEFHRDRCHCLVIVSASLSEWITPWAKENGFSIVLATNAEFCDCFLTGGFSSECLYGIKKIEALLIAFPNLKENFFLVAYGDSKGDREMLAFADQSFYKPFNN